MERSSLVAETVAALREAAVAARTPELMIRVAQEIEKAAKREPWMLGIRGDELADVTALFDHMAGGGLLEARAPGCPALRLRHGKRTGFVAFRDRAPPEELSMLSVLEAAKRDSRPRLEEHHTRPHAKGALARVLAWLRSLVARVFRRPQLPPAIGPDAFVARLRELAAGPGDGVVEIVLNVADGPLSPNIEVIELGEASDTGQLDAVLVVAGAQLCAPDSARASVGELRRAIAALPELIENARAMKLAARALDATAQIVAAVDAEDRAAAADLAGRIADLEDLRVADPEGFARDQITRVRAQIFPSVAMVMQHVAAHMGSDLVQLGNEWRAAIGGVSTGGELGDAVGKINETSAASVRRIAEDVRLLVMGGVAGCVRDLFADVVAPLRKRGMSEALARPRPDAPPLPPVPVLPSLANPSAMKVGSAGWFGALFRSVESRRTDIREKVEHHIARIEEIANAEMRDAEPALHTAVEAALADELAAALDRHRVWVDGAIAAEHAEFALQREAVAARTARVDAARREVARLREALAQLVTRHPHAATAASATA
jgi:hypothetical protein